MENKLNLPPFYVGQKVVCLHSDSQNRLIKNKIYTITGIYKCKSCGLIDVSFGLYSGKDGVKYTCDNNHWNDANGEWVCVPDWFAPIQEQKPPLLTFSQIKETEKEEILILN